MYFQGEEENRNPTVESYILFTQPGQISLIVHGGNTEVGC